MMLLFVNKSQWIQGYPYNNVQSLAFPCEFLNCIEGKNYSWWPKVGHNLSLSYVYSHGEKQKTKNNKTICKYHQSCVLAGKEIFKK